MSKQIDEAQAILADKGAGLMQSDLIEIETLLVQADPDDWESGLFVMEGVALIVNDPSYKGDIPPIA